MTDFVLGLVPDYGLYVLFAVVALACLAVPLPASMVVLASGSFAAAGDLVLWQVFVVASLAYGLGDQVAYFLARFGGRVLFRNLSQIGQVEAMLARSADLLARRGPLAVLLSHTVVSPTCAYVTFLCGAGGMTHRAYTMAAIPGALAWTAVYCGLGYIFAGQLAQVSEMVSSFSGLVLAALVALGSIVWLTRQWRARGLSLAPKSAR